MSGLGANPRVPDARIVVRPNESIWWDGLGALIGDIAEAAVRWGPVIEVDTSDRTRPDEQRGGASPIVSIALVLSGVGLKVLTDVLSAVLIEWVKARRRVGDDPSHLVIYGPDGKEVLWEACVDDDGVQPVSKYRHGK